MMLEVAPGVLLLEGLPAVYLKKEDAVVIADLHLGYEESMAKQGVYLPRLQLRKAIRLVRKARELTGARRLIIDGDLKHEFSKLLKSEKLETAKLLRSAFEAGYKDVIVVRGNHDNFIGPIVTSLGGEFVDDLMVDDILLRHGHKKPTENMPDIIIIGHEHPSLAVSLGGAKAKLPVLLVAPARNSKLIIVLPAAGAYQTGNAITLDPNSYLSPLMREFVDPREIAPIIVDEKEGLLPLPKLGLLVEAV